MDKLLTAYCTFQAFMTADRDEERGQGTLEYLGMFIVAGVIVVALISFFRGSNLFSDAFQSAVELVTNEAG